MPPQFRSKTWARLNKRKPRQWMRKQYRTKYRKKRSQPFRSIGYPKSMVVKHRYVQGTGLTCTVGITNYYVFSCNGMYNPNITGTGHQPMFFDNQCAIYDHYHVIGSKIIYRIMPANGTSAENPFRVACFIADTSITSGFGTPDNIAENNAGRMQIVPALSPTKTTLGLRFSTKKYARGSVLGNPNLEGTSAANPTEQYYFVLALDSFDSSTVYTWVEFQIEYIAVWHELRQQTSN
nr:MAG: capsid protein [Cressdnaviricota sp.]